MEKYWILMADMAGSSKQPGKPLMEQFSSLVSMVNEEYSAGILSPLSITLGDEFQGVVGDLSVAREIIFRMDEELLRGAPFFRLRFVANFGGIETSVNRETAYGMLGPGLTDAREQLNALKKSDEEILVTGLDSPESERLIALAFRWYRSVYQSWPEKDRQVAADFLMYGDYKKVARLHSRDASSMWRKGQTLGIDNFMASREMITLLTENGDLA